MSRADHPLNGQHASLVKELRDIRQRTMLIENVRTTLFYVGETYCHDSITYNLK